MHLQTVIVLHPLYPLIAIHHVRTTTDLNTKTLLPGVIHFLVILHNHFQLAIGEIQVHLLEMGCVILGLPMRMIRMLLTHI